MFTPTINFDLADLDNADLDNADLDNATEAIDALSPEHRQAIHLTYYAGFNNVQIANLLGVSADVADARLSAGLTELRDALRFAA